MSDLLREFQDWIGSELRSAEVSGFMEITTPFLDHRNDCIQIYVRELPDGTYFLTDDGATMLDFFGTDVSFEPRFQECFGIVLRGFGVQMGDNEMQTFATAENVGERIGALVQAMLACGMLHVLVPESSTQL